MQTKTNHPAHSVFLYLVALVTLHVLAIGVGTILFQIINKLVPDVSSYVTFYESTIKFAIAEVMIFGPVYFLTMWAIYKGLKTGKISLESGIRKWLTYLILFIASCVILGQGSGVLWSFLNGELSTRVLLKAFVVLGISFLIFVYYWQDIRHKDVAAKKFQYGFFFTGVLLTVASFVSGFFFIDNPFTTRQRNLDGGIESKLSNIQNTVQMFYNQEKKLPKELTELLVNPSKGKYYLQEGDLSEAMGKNVFTYTVKEAKTYELCAEFYIESKKDPQNTTVPSYPYGGRADWTHTAGKNCFTREVLMNNVGY